MERLNFHRVSIQAPQQWQLTSKLNYFSVRPGFSMPVTYHHNNERWSQIMCFILLSASSITTNSRIWLALQASAQLKRCTCSIRTSSSYFIQSWELFHKNVAFIEGEQMCISGLFIYHSRRIRSWKVFCISVTSFIITSLRHTTDEFIHCMQSTTNQCFYRFVCSFGE